MTAPIGQILIGRNRSNEGYQFRLPHGKYRLKESEMRIRCYSRNPVTELPSFDRKSGAPNVITETPRGCRNKYLCGEKRKMFKVSRRSRPRNFRSPATTRR